MAISIIPPKDRPQPPVEIISTSGPHRPVLFVSRLENTWQQIKTLSPAKWIITVTILLLIAVLFWGCATQRNAEKYYKKHPHQLALDCAEKYPLKDSTITRIDTIYKSNNIDYTAWVDSLDKIVDASVQKQYDDSVTASRSHADCEAIVQAQAVEKRSLQQRVAYLSANYKPCKPDTIRSTITVRVRDRAYEQTQTDSVRSCEDKVLLLSADYAKEHKLRKKFMWWFFILLGAAGLYTFLKVKSIIKI